MLGKIYDYIYYTTFTIISKTNSRTPTYSSASLLSVMALVNVMSIFFLFENRLSTTGFYIFFGVGILIRLYVLNRYNERYAKRIIDEYGLVKTKKICEYIIDFYPDASILFLIISTGADAYTISFCVGFIIIVRILLYLAKGI